MLNQVSDEAHCEVRYSEKSVVKLGNFFSGGTSNERYVQEIAGAISRFNILPSMSAFQLFRDSRKQWSSKFDGLKFLTTPGYDLDEIDSRELDFMDELRAVIGNYFLKNPKQKPL